MPPKSKKKIPPKKAVKAASKASESESEDDAPKVVPKSSGRRSGRQNVEEPKNTRASRGSQKENGSSKRKQLSRSSSSSSSSDSSDDEPIQVKSKTPPKKRKSNVGAENGEASKQVRGNPKKIYEVEKIVAHEGNGSARKYRIRWKGWGPESDTWEPKKKLNCPKLLAKYIAENPDAKHKAPVPKKSRKKKKKQVERPARALKVDEEPDYDSEDIDENEDWEVEKIIDVHRNRDGTREFLIRWKNYSSNSDSWEPESQLNCPDLIKKFMDKLESLAIGDAKELRVNRQATQRYTLMTQSAARRLSKRHNNKQRAVYYDAEL